MVGNCCVGVGVLGLLVSDVLYLLLVLLVRLRSLVVLLLLLVSSGCFCELVDRGNSPDSLAGRVVLYAVLVGHLASLTMTLCRITATVGERLPWYCPRYSACSL